MNSSFCWTLWLICQVFWAIYLTSVSRKWRKMKDSNLRTPYGVNTLAGCRFKPLSQSSIVVLTGIEPVTHGFSIHCSTNWAIIPILHARQDSNLKPSVLETDILPIELRTRVWWFYPSLSPFLRVNVWFNHHCSPWRIRTLIAWSVAKSVIHYTKGLLSSLTQTRTADPYIISVVL